MRTERRFGQGVAEPINVSATSLGAERGADLVPRGHEQYHLTQLCSSPVLSDQSAMQGPFEKQIYMTIKAYIQAAGVQVQSFSASDRQSAADQGGSQRAADSTKRANFRHVAWSQSCFVIGSTDWIGL